KRKCRALFGEEAALLCVLFRACEIDLLVRGVEIANDEYGTPPPQRLNAVEHGRVEGELVRHAAVVALRAAAFGEIPVDDSHFPEARGDQPTFHVEAPLAPTDHHLVRGCSRIGRHAAVRWPARREARMPAG